MADLLLLVSVKPYVLNQVGDRGLRDHRPTWPDAGHPYRWPTPSHARMWPTSGCRWRRSRRGSWQPLDELEEGLRNAWNSRGVSLRKLLESRSCEVYKGGYRSRHVGYPISSHYICLASYRYEHRRSHWYSTPSPPGAKATTTTTTVHIYIYMYSYIYIHIDNYLV
jgi:hypothetical protein